MKHIIAEPHPNSIKVFFYRYYESIYSLGLPDEDGRAPSSYQLKLEVRSYPVVKTTPKGVWISSGYDEKSDLHFIRLSAKKKFACPTKEEALASFVARKKRQIYILKSQLKKAEAALSLAQENNPNKQETTVTEISWFQDNK